MTHTKSARPPRTGGSLVTKLLPSVLSVTAGSVDVISFLALGRLFTAQITDNLAILAAHVFAGGQARVAHILSVQFLMMALGLTRLLVGGLGSIGVASLRLQLHFLLLAGFLILNVAAGPRIDPNAAKYRPRGRAQRFGDGGAERARNA